MDLRPCGGSWLSPALPAVIHSGDYYLFESDSEEDEEAQPEDPRPSAQSAFQVGPGHPVQPDLPKSCGKAGSGAQAPPS